MGIEWTGRVDQEDCSNGLFSVWKKEMCEQRDHGGMISLL